MIVVAFLIGTMLPAVNGWLALHIIEGDSPVLFRYERWVFGFLLGMTATMTCTFFLSVWIGLPLTLFGFLAAQALFLFFLGLFVWRRRDAPRLAVRAAPSSPLPLAGKLLLVFLCAWTVLKLFVGGFELVSLPPGYDDTVKNWNYRAKIFYFNGTVQAEYPLTGQLASYPPAVSITKTWYATLAGRWSEGLINAPHFLWFLASVALLFFALRRSAGRNWALLGTYLLIGVPLYFVHGTAAYAEVFLAVHLLAAVSLLLHAIGTDDPSKRRTYLRLAAVFTALLPLTKNEGLVLYLPIVLLCVVLCCFLDRKPAAKSEWRSVVVWFVASLLVSTLPLLLYKWSHQFVFGNAHNLVWTSPTWSPLAIYTIGINLFAEGNWLLLFPTFIGFLVVGWRHAFSRPLLLLTAILLLALGAQLALFVCDKSYAIEATMQTGYSRGVVHVIPLACLWLTLIAHHLLHHTAKN